MHGYLFQTAQNIIDKPINLSGEGEEKKKEKKRTKTIGVSGTNPNTLDGSVCYVTNT